MSGTPTPSTPTPVLDPDKLICKTCGFMAADFDDLRNHNNSMHLAPAPSPAPAPPPTSSGEATTTTEPFDPDQLTCKVCGFMAENPKELREHNNEKHIRAVTPSVTLATTTPSHEPSPAHAVREEMPGFKETWSNPIKATAKVARIVRNKPKGH